MANLRNMKNYSNRYENMGQVDWGGLFQTGLGTLARALPGIGDWWGGNGKDKQTIIIEQKPLPWVPIIAIGAGALVIVAIILKRKRR